MTLTITDQPIFEMGRLRLQTKTRVPVKDLTPAISSAN